MKVRIAWVSRHVPIPAQVRELKRIFGDISIVQISRVFTDAEEVYREVKKRNCTHAVVVLPLSIISLLLKHEDIVWIYAEMKALHTCDVLYCGEWDPDTDVWLPLKGEKEGRHMRFKKFWRIKEVRMVLEELTR